jgi:hypothetical protein
LLLTEGANKGLIHAGKMLSKPISWFRRKKL